MSLHVLKKRYKIVRQLAKKAGRTTLLARDLYTNELVVIKLLIFNSEIEWEELQLFKKEAQILRNLSFSAIPSYIDFFEIALPNKKALASVQSYIKAVTLEQHIQNQGVFSETEVKQLAKYILQILIYLQEQNPSVVHRDIKPSNILLTNRSGNSIGDVYLIDFGSVQTLNSSDGVFTVVGTYGYMAPEQFGGRAVAASDLYSLGTTLIYLLTGKSPADLPQKAGRFKVGRITNCSQELGKWLTKMVEPELEKRFKSAAEALKSLEKLSFIELSDFAPKLPNKISIKKSTDVIEIITPCKKNRESSIVHFISAANIAILYGTFSVLLLPKVEAIFQSIFMNYGLINNYSLTATAILMVVLYIYVTIWLKIIVNMLFIPFGKKKLQIDKQRISFYYKLFGLEYRYQASIPRQAIIKLDSNKNKVAEVIIWLGIYKYSFGKGLLNTKQAAWLSRELSDWLGIKTIYL
ncbi:MAG: serine/threonine protein kinase [Rivularia sp. (in: Bacteria)]|nr:serine/threonine protein kinase [Rivularia sp. MS3]